MEFIVIHWRLWTSTVRAVRPQIKSLVLTRTWLHGAEEWMGGSPTTWINYPSTQFSEWVASPNQPLHWRTKKLLRQVTGHSYSRRGWIFGLDARCNFIVTAHDYLLSKGHCPGETRSTMLNYTQMDSDYEPAGSFSPSYVYRACLSFQLSERTSKILLTLYSNSISATTWCMLRLWFFPRKMHTDCPLVFADLGFRFT